MINCGSFGEWPTIKTAMLEKERFWHIKIKFIKTLVALHNLQTSILIQLSRITNNRITHNFLPSAVLIRCSPANVGEIRATSNKVVFVAKALKIVSTLISNAASWVDLHLHFRLATMLSTRNASTKSAVTTHRAAGIIHTAKHYLATPKSVNTQAYALTGGLIIYAVSKFLFSSDFFACVTDIENRSKIHTICATEKAC